MPAPAPNTIWVSPIFGGSLITFENYLGQRQSLHRQRRATILVMRISKNTWQCPWCSSRLPMWKRVDAIYCGESCRKKAARGRKRHPWVSISS
mgnify:FL=1|jgi:hypothetical protein